MEEAGSYKSPCEDGVYRTFDERMAWKAEQKRAEEERKAALNISWKDWLDRKLDGLIKGVGRLIGEHVKAMRATITDALALERARIDKALEKLDAEFKRNDRILEQRLADAEYRMERMAETKLRKLEAEIAKLKAERASR
ncbi:hypothetical protein [Ensifer sp. SSB1]|jgi:hypothetical protein|uniref:hypothetical protein n=1 Tax=Ensifer sp. SSB1 TaxID=2795385 RepID=UPI001A4FC0C8|nr:hypothetical protein [Ensifer sp. SSB1]MBK5567231.1 hypothetical protein [Ensifer sp. SSB1]